VDAGLRRVDLTGMTPNSVKSVRSEGWPTATTTRLRSREGEFGQQRSSRPLDTPRPACDDATHSSAISSMPGKPVTIT
jgi:hypothetical protein